MFIDISMRISSGAMFWEQEVSARFIRVRQSRLGMCRTNRILTLTLFLDCRCDLFVGTYLGVDIAIKEILPSDKYDV